MTAPVRTRKCSATGCPGRTLDVAIYEIEAGDEVHGDCLANLQSDTFTASNGTVITDRGGSLHIAVGTLVLAYLNEDTVLALRQYFEVTS